MPATIARKAGEERVPRPINKSTVRRRPVQIVAMKPPSGEQDLIIVTVPLASRSSLTRSTSNAPGENLA